MSFFQQLHAISPDADITLRIMTVNGKFTVGITPSVKEHKIPPLTLTGTPEEMDAEFIQRIKAPLAEANMVIKGIGEQKAAIQEAVQEETKVPEKKETKPAPSKPSKPAAKSKGGKKPAPSKATKPAPVTEPADDQEDEDKDHGAHEETPAPAETAPAPAPEAPADDTPKQHDIFSM